MAKVDPDNPVITVTRAGLDTKIVRWFPDVWSAERNHVMITVSTNGLSIHTRYLHEIPESWLESAKDVCKALRADPFAHVDHVATHRNSVVSNGPLVPVGGSGG